MAAKRRSKRGRKTEKREHKVPIKVVAETELSDEEERLVEAFIEGWREGLTDLKNKAGAELANPDRPAASPDEVVMADARTLVRDFFSL